MLWTGAYAHYLAEGWEGAARYLQENKVTFSEAETLRREWEQGFADDRCCVSAFGCRTCPFNRALFRRRP